MRGIAATERTLTAIRRADKLRLNIPGGVMSKGAYPAEAGGDTYTGYFALTYDGNDITAAAGLLKAGNSFATVAETTVTATAAGYVILTVTYSGGYIGAVTFATALTSLADGNDVIVLATVEWADGAVTAVNRQICGPALVTGKSV